MLALPVVSGWVPFLRIARMRGLGLLGKAPQTVNLVLRLRRFDSVPAYFRHVAQLVEHRSEAPERAGSNPAVSAYSSVAQLVERPSPKRVVAGSIPVRVAMGRRPPEKVGSRCCEGTGGTF